MTLKSFGAASLLALSLVVVSGCDQVEKSAQQVIGKASESAKQVIDDTQKAAEQALSEATQGLITPRQKDDQTDKEAESNNQET
jgi:vacuolar-type H+-ATPase subunit H